ncbi:aspartyl-phosphate phosphatase Spo0E family protein [Bacillus pseudomycoides]|uniref:aspartyl-phosphate phosphatase Spo0E family protein n=1 Tax=Bacillus pseudomycoides TaxID=64104 RepID=UPI001FB2BC3C|nr:aspartyl-phosphate phosphatase Spo0E family protein [Bacillus pseudomycoides]
MKLKKYLNEYNQFKREMEISGRKYGLTNQKTVEFSRKLDLLLNEFMMIKYPELNKQDRLG